MLIVGSHSVIWSFLFLLILIIMVVTIDPPDLLVPLLSLALASTTFEYSTTWTLGLAAQRQNWKKIISNEFYFAMSGWARVFCVLLINCDFIPFITSSFLLFSSIVCFGCIQPWDIFWSKLCCSWGVKKYHSREKDIFYLLQRWQDSQYCRGQWCCEKLFVRHTVLIKRFRYFVLLNYSFKSWSIFKTRDEFGISWSQVLAEIFEVKES